MRERWRHIVAPRSVGERRARREYILNVTVVAMGGLAVLNVLVSGIALLWIANVASLALTLSIVVAASCLLIYRLGRRGHVTLAGYVLSLVIWGMATGLLAVGGWGTMVPVGYVLCVALATLLNGLPGGMAVGVLSLASYGIVGWQFSQGTLPDLLSLPKASLGTDLIILGTTLCAACALFYALDRQLSVTSTRRLSEMRLYADELETVAREREDLIHQLQTTTKRQEELLAAMRAISAPVLPVLEGVIVMPLVGKLDPRRAQLLLDDVLAGVMAYRADYVLLDVTGMPEIGPDAAQSLVKAINGVRMLGGECQLVGVQPAVARELVFLDTDLPAVVSYSTLREGISELLGQRMANPLLTQVP